jgi:putative acetyltransferase
MDCCIIRPPNATEHDAIDALVSAAFGQPDEAGIVERLRKRDWARGERVAAEGAALVGHILFSPVAVGGQPPSELWWGLAPLAVRPDRQRLGIGTRLAKSGLDAARAAGVDLVVVLGEPDYYRRLGFGPAAELGLGCIYPAPPDCFMALRLSNRPTPPGIVLYDPAFEG